MMQSDWGNLLDALLDATWLVDPNTLRIVAINSMAAALVGLDVDALLGKPTIELTATPEDLYFWEDVAAGVSTGIHSQTLLRHVDGLAIPVDRRVHKIWLKDNTPAFMVSVRDLRSQQQAEVNLENRLAELRATLESTADAILVTDLQGNICNYNRHFATLWEIPNDLLTAHDNHALYSHLNTQIVEPTQHMPQPSDLQQDDAQATDLLILRCGRIVERVTTHQRSRGKTIGQVYSFRDITQQVQAQAQQRLAAKVFEFSLDAIFITDANFELLQINPRCAVLTGKTSQTLVGSSARTLFYDVQQPDFFHQVEFSLAVNGSWSGDVWCMVGNARCAMQVTWIAMRNATGEVQHTVGFFQDITERIEAQKRIETLASTDVLTGLPNRLLLTQRVDLALHMAQRRGGTCAVLFMNLDRFKSVNDSMGNACGDKVLVEVAVRTRQCLREVDTLSRLGADEFVCFLHDADELGAEIVARRIIDAIAQPFIIGSMNFSLGCSIGVSMCPEDGNTVDGLIKCAETAMQRVKDRGRGNFRFYQPQMNVDWLARVKMDYAMRQAMEKNQFRLHYQPQISLSNGSLVGAEALIRWTDLEMGNVSPGAFIPYAEESGFIITIGNWVMNEAIRQAAQWQQAGHPVVVSVNVSALQFQQQDFVERVSTALRTNQLQATWLELELTESILIKDANEALSRLHALAALGVGLAIDDFGTGYSSLSYLKKFPISKLKIDRAFVMGLPQDESDRAIVGATVAMARALKLDVVAEGVETAAQRDYLQALQCESFQGYLCSPALPVIEFERLMEKLPTGSRLTH